jgi:hypothetical protein
LGFCGLRWRKKVLRFLKDKEWREDLKVVVRVWIRFVIKWSRYAELYWVWIEIGIVFLW